MRETKGLNENIMASNAQSTRISVSKGRVESEKRRRSFKFIVPILLVCTIILIILIQSLDSTEAKKIKIKDLKKAKKYAYLLAGQRKKLYAIPFPVPLPVFVKRQHIYTQVPVIPRYVQQPTNNYYSSDIDPYASMSSQLEVHPSYYHPMPSASQQEGSIKPSSSQTSKVTSKYLGQLASVISQTYPLQRDVISKILNGQAKIITPNQMRVGSLLAGLKNQNSKQTYESPKYSGLEGSSSNNSSFKAESSPPVKSSSNELYTSAARHPRPVELVPSDFYRMPSSMMHPYSPYMVSPAHMSPKMPMFHPQMVNELMQMVEPQLMEASGQVETQQAIQPEIQEQAASDAREYEMDKMGKLSPDQLMAAALQKARQQQALESSLARVKAEEARVAEINTLALHAQQLGLPLMPGQLRLFNY